MVSTGMPWCVEDIQRQRLPLPVRDMRPASIEEEIICYADKFYSKNSDQTPNPRSIEEIIAMLRHYGERPARRFEAWARRFENGLRPPSPATKAG